MNDPVFLLGAGGFIGRHLARALASEGREVVAATRRPVAFDPPGIRNVVQPWDERAQFAEWIARCGAVVRWQWEPVRQRRLEVPGHHAPGADAVVPVLVGLVLALSCGYLSYRLADRLSHQAFSQFITEKLPPPASPAMRTMEFPGMPKG